jgi:hypothetical protein
MTNDQLSELRLYQDIKYSVICLSETDGVVYYESKWYDLLLACSNFYKDL